MWHCKLLQAFSPKAVYEKKEEVSEELLLNLIKQGCVEDSYTVYKLLEEDTSVECKQALLELLCYYNSQEQIPDDLLEERWYRNMTKQANQWKYDRNFLCFLFGSIFSRLSFRHRFAYTSFFIWLKNCVAGETCLRSPKIKDVVSCSGPFWKLISRFIFITKYDTIVLIFFICFYWHHKL